MNTSSRNLCCCKGACAPGRAVIPSQMREVISQSALVNYVAYSRTDSRSNLMTIRHFIRLRKVVLPGASEYSTKECSVQYKNRQWCNSHNCPHYVSIAHMECSQGCSCDDSCLIGYAAFCTSISCSTNVTSSTAADVSCETG